MMRSRSASLHKWDAHKCTFCTTGLMGLARNMTAPEISAQVYTIADRFHDSIDDYHLIFMGMGEPFLNYNNVLACVSEFLEASTPVRDVTISTSGVPHAIRRLVQKRCHQHLRFPSYQPIKGYESN